MKKRFLLVLAGIMGLAFIASGCKDKKTTKETTAKTTVQTTATPTTTEDIKLFKTDKETFDSFFAYDETGLKSVNFEAEDLIKREGKEDQETTLIVADGRVNTVKWNTIYVIAKDDVYTNVPGIYVAGDARVKMLRQLTTAVGDGANAALSACDYVDKFE